MDRLLQKLDCPYGHGAPIMIIDTGNGLAGQCIYAVESLRKHSWSKVRMERDLRNSGCPRSEGITRTFRKPECPFNTGKYKFVFGKK